MSYTPSPPVIAPPYSSSPIPISSSLNGSGKDSFSGGIAAVAFAGSGFAAGGCLFLLFFGANSDSGTPP